MQLRNVVEETQKQRDLLDKQVQLKEGHIVLNPEPENSLAVYSIALHRCDTPAKLIGWIQHLSSKNWLTMKILDRFIREACDQNRMEIERDF